MKTSNLVGHALDWAVAKCETEAGGNTFNPDCDLKGGFDNTGNEFPAYSPSTDWAQGGPLNDREGITIAQQFRLNSAHDWVARLEWLDEPQGEGFGPTTLIAAMRCFVASKLGDEVEIPEELK